ncbi:uncharacterized protein LOC129767859 [Toxorhynchites rutilus septentrionalis]|uniref:uncharacterized protein LOC129767859 n=1 Tax=Toxorhynchites rutilus septentrionalis TaxID=329112 RepID=UPI002478CB59|nr:uncharacterized protein LOC129767859 [Toxorhynchites rutilus septentrionalis]
MPCESCNVQFGLIVRKKSCNECRRLFCRNCLEKRGERILCSNCLILTKRPISRVDLGQLKVKDLIFYLQSKHISTSGCVEKGDLINLIVAHVNSGASSPRSPAGSTGSGNGGLFNFSSASSTGDSSHNGGRGNHSGSSSRYGNLYSASAENCANTFDQIKNTCQNLFSTITEKLSTDIPKPTHFGPRFSHSSTDENIPTRGQSETNVSQQPRFGANDVYRQQENGRTTNGSQSLRDNGVTVPNERVFSPTNGSNNGSSGLTSGADSSGNTSSVSSPEHQKPRSSSGAGVGKPSFETRIDDMLASDANHGGCECSDEETDAAFAETPRRKESRKAASEDNLFTEPGTSQSESGYRMGTGNEKEPFPPFEELNAECVFSMSGASNAANNRKISVNLNSTGHNKHLHTVVNASVMTETDGISCSLNSKVIPEGIPPSIVASPSRVQRRRSDSFLIALMHTESSATELELETTAHSSQVTVPNKCCKCGKRRNGIRRQLKKIRKQLQTTSIPEVDKRRQLEAFLSYLERRSKGSLELSDTESITEDASISVADPAAEGIASSSSWTGGPEDSMMGGIQQQHSNYPQAERVAPEQINVYSTGNQELASMSHIKLSDIKESADLDVLSVKQLKEILMLNRVDFKGCCEKPELRERVLRLWRDYKSIPSIEKLPSDDLCKICMDAPIECVILECGHMTTCTACGKVLSECPICRQYIVRVVRFFRA